MTDPQGQSPHPPQLLLTAAFGGALPPTAQQPEHYAQTQHCSDEVSLLTPSIPRSIVPGSTLHYMPLALLLEHGLCLSLPPKATRDPITVTMGGPLSRAFCLEQSLKNRAFPKLL